ncbi:hypothetical protein L6452_02761 [Arctium lappa]|uniref:Uncharacterized protein n=1 Tax=Arctium lappa TaxID=4217 RepID=A0ACB9FLB5_ARCLA|nr:hypothetical protein L6452_02761 [Arctium lappa]
MSRATPMEVCPICLHQLDHFEPTTSLICQHFFHASCLSMWVIVNPTCPMCRRLVEYLIPNQRISGGHAYSKNENSPSGELQPQMTVQRTPIVQAESENSSSSPVPMDIDEDDPDYMDID